MNITKEQPIEFKAYLGTKLINAAPMTRGEYDIFKGWVIPSGENPNDEGYVVQYSDSYISWSPKEAFEEAYKLTSGLSFGYALDALEKGFKVARRGWNGKGMYLWLLPATKVEKSWVKDPMLLEAFEGKDTLECLGSIRMKTATGEVLTGWLASQSDMLAKDWVLVN